MNSEIYVSDADFVEGNCRQFGHWVFNKLENNYY